MRSGAAKTIFPVILAFLVASISSSPARQDISAAVQTPPMGWNSWDSWGMTIDEAQFRATASWFQQNLQRFNWQYLVIDEGWYLAHPESPAGQQGFTISGDGRYMPAVDRFPSAANGKGFRPLADWLHSIGLKFGIHIIRGIPREAVLRNLRIAGSHYTAAEAADTSDTCSWNSDNYGVRNNKAGQAYYDSIAALYAKWGVDYLKVDCISHPWRSDEIHMVERALTQSGRSIVLSLSPGPTPIEDADDAVRSAQLWRISDDMWDLWSKSAGAPPFPQGLRNQFPLVAQWEPYAGPGHWPDADMLPIGYLGPHPGWGQPRQTRLTHDEVRTLMTLWSIGRSPLFIGTNLLHMDAFTESILTNPDVLAVDQYAENNHVVFQNENTVLWMASVPQRGGNYVAVFNVSNAPQSTTYSWQDLGLPPFTHFRVRDLWSRRELGYMDHLGVELAPHSSGLYEIEAPH